MTDYIPLTENMFVMAIHKALQAERYLKARKIAIQAHETYPESKEMRKWCLLLSPPVAFASSEEAEAKKFLCPHELKQIRLET